MKENPSIKIIDQKAQALDVALDALDKFALDHTNADRYSEAQSSISVYAQLCLLDKASSSTFAAAELSKQHRLFVKLSMQNGLANLAKNLDKINLSFEETQALKDKMDLIPQYKEKLTEEGVKKAFEKGEITIDYANKLMGILSKQQDGEKFDGTFRVLGELKEVVEKI